MKPLIRIEGLSVGFPVRGGVFQAIRSIHTVLKDIDLAIPAGKTLGLVGESGCGKTTLGRAILGLVPVQKGSIYFQAAAGVLELTSLPERKFRPLRKKLQMVFQDPFSSLNQRMTVRQILTEPLRYHFKSEGHRGWEKRCAQALENVGMSSNSLSRYPHEFSGGQRQRISIARALILEPQCIVCDECVSALDVSIQAQIINLLIDLQERFKLTYLFISHDLSVVRHISHDIAVIKDGVIVEKGPALEVADRPSHEYTKRLLAALPSLRPAV